MNYATFFSQKKTPQSLPIPGQNQVQNSNGGYSFEVDLWTQVDRFLILGSEAGTYYISAATLTVENANSILKAINEDGVRLVERIIELSQTGRTVKNDPSIFALALAASFGNEEVRALALASVGKVCRTGTHLFAFVEVVSKQRGWGRGLRRAVANWYNDKPSEQLALTLVKYQQRNGWSNRDVIRLAHPKPATEEHKGLFRWAVSGEFDGESELVRAMKEIRTLGTAQEVAAVVRRANVPREAVPTEWLKSPEVWEALLERMPVTALIRSLGVLSKLGLTEPDSESLDKIVSDLQNAERIRKSRLHPLTILISLTTYASGRGVQGSSNWIPAPQVVDALNSAFYAAFANAESTGKRLVLGLDVSGSMCGTSVAGSAALSCRDATGALALITSATESKVTHLAFDTQVYPLALSRSQRLDDVTAKLASVGGGGTDCSAPIEFATRKRLKADAFIIYTDSESWGGSQHPVQALNEYRKVMKINAKLITVAMASNRFTVGNVRDPGTLNVVGFDASIPQVITEFLRNS